MCTAWHSNTRLARSQPTDLIFPFFLFIVGVAITLSVGKRKDRGDSKGVILRHAFVRAGIIFAIGVFLYAFRGLMWRQCAHTRRATADWGGLLHYYGSVPLAGSQGASLGYRGMPGSVLVCHAQLSSSRRRSG